MFLIGFYVRSSDNLLSLGPFRKSESDLFDPSYFEKQPASLSGLQSALAGDFDEREAKSMCTRSNCFLFMAMNS